MAAFAIGNPADAISTRRPACLSQYSRRSRKRWSGRSRSLNASLRQSPGDEPPSRTHLIIGSARDVGFGERAILQRQHDPPSHRGSSQDPQRHYENRATATDGLLGGAVAVARCSAIVSGGTNRIASKIARGRRITSSRYPRTEIKSGIRSMGESA